MTRNGQSARLQPCGDGLWTTLATVFLSEDPARFITRLIEGSDRIRHPCPSLIAVGVTTCFAVIGACTGRFFGAGSPEGNGRFCMDFNGLLERDAHAAFPVPLIVRS